MSASDHDKQHDYLAETGKGATKTIVFTGNADTQTDSTVCRCDFEEDRKDVKAGIFTEDVSSLDDTN